MSTTVNILDYGAIANLEVLQTGAIQSAVDACRDAGGGTVEIPKGSFHIGSIRLYSHIALHLLSGAKLIASDNWKEYVEFNVPTTLGYIHDPGIIKKWNIPTHYVHSPITAFLSEDIAVIGEEGSEINGSNCFDPNGEEGFRGPMGMVMCQCRNVTLRGYTYVDSANWCHQLDSCENVLVENVTVLAGHDGINIHHCKNVTIENCVFRTGDDCVAGYDVVNVVVRNCELNTSCNSFRLGSINMLVENCRFLGPGDYPHRISGRHNTLFAFEYYSFGADTVSNDGGNWLIRNCSFENIDGLIHYDFGSPMQENKPLLDVRMEDVTIKGLNSASAFCARSGKEATLTLRNTSIGFRNGVPDPFLTVDKNVTLVLEHLTFDKKAVIEIDRNTSVSVKDVTCEGEPAGQELFRHRL